MLIFERFENKTVALRREVRELKTENKKLKSPKEKRKIKNEPN